MPPSKHTLCAVFRGLCNHAMQANVLTHTPLLSHSQRPAINGIQMVAVALVLATMTVESDRLQGLAIVDTLVRSC